LVFHVYTQSRGFRIAFDCVARTEIQEPDFTTTAKPAPGNLGRKTIHADTGAQTLCGQRRNCRFVRATLRSCNDLERIVSFERSIEAPSKACEPPERDLDARSAKIDWIRVVAAKFLRRDRVANPGSFRHVAHVGVIASRVQADRPAALESVSNGDAAFDFLVRNSVSRAGVEVEGCQRVQPDPAAERHAF